jgi:hypothetical protein
VATVVDSVTAGADKTVATVVDSVTAGADKTVATVVDSVTAGALTFRVFSCRNYVLILHVS